MEPCRDVPQQMLRRATRSHATIIYGMTPVELDELAATLHRFRSGVLSQSEAARFCGFQQQNRIIEARTSGELPYVQFPGSGRFFYRSADLETWISRHVQQTAA